MANDNKAENYFKQITQPHPKQNTRNIKEKRKNEGLTLKRMCNVLVLLYFPIFSASEVFSILKLVSSVRGMYIEKQNWLCPGFLKQTLVQKQLYIEYI